MKKKILTIDNLVEFCMKNKFHHFSSIESGYQLSVAVPSTFEIQEFEDSGDSKQGLMKLKIRVLHTLKNRNQSYVSKESAEEAAPSIKGRPILAYIHQLDDGSWDFGGHEIDFIEDENGNVFIEYVEKQVGAFTDADPFFEYDEETDKEYLCSYAIIPTEYTKAAEIIRRKGGTKTSSELYVDEMTYDAKQKTLYLNKFYVSGLTLLGTEDDGTPINEGMEGARADIIEFSVGNNTAIDNSQNIQGREESPVTKFEELLQKYNVSAEDITFEYADLTDEELENKFAEVFDNIEKEEEQENPEEEVNSDEGEMVENAQEDVNATNEENELVVNEGNEENVIVDNSENEIDNNEDVVTITYSSNINGDVQIFERTMESTLSQLYQAVSKAYGNEGAWYTVDAYPDSKVVIMHDYHNDHYYRQSYEVNDNDCYLVGERIQVYPRFLSQEEIEKFDGLNEQLANTTAQLETYQDAENKAKKLEILNSADYETLHEEEVYINFRNEIIKDHKTFSVEDVQKKCDDLLLSYVKTNKSLKFADNGEKIIPTRITLFPIKNTKQNRYGNLFSK